MKILRTPDERFANLPGYSFQPHYADVGGGLRMHYVDEGPREAAPVLLLHGEPSWGFLYRKLVGPIAAAGHRVIVPDLIGFGRSDKPAAREDYTYERHVGWVANFIAKVRLGRITLVCQDWGGLIGLRLAAEHEARFARIVAANTFLPTGNEPVSDAFRSWRAFSQETSEFEVGKIVARGCALPVSPEVIAAYDAPFPDETFKAGARQFPMLVPITPDDPASAANRAAWTVLGRWTKPVLTAFSDQDPITRGADKLLQMAIPGAKDQPHTTIQEGGHFLQEDQGEALAAVVVDFIARTVGSTSGKP
jgi:haloalkane dehalogenase